MSQLPVAQLSEADFDQLIDVASSGRSVQDASVQDGANAHYELDRAFLERNLVNGNSFIPNAKALGPLFKARMFVEVQP